MFEPDNLKKLILMADFAAASASLHLRRHASAQRMGDGESFDDALWQKPVA